MPDIRIELNKLFSDIQFNIESLISDAKDESFSEGYEDGYNRGFADGEKSAGGNNG